jgi:inner membrane protein
VDSITQATLGAAVGEALLGKKLGNRAVAWGLLFGTLPDLDVIFSPFLDNARQLESLGWKYIPQVGVNLSAHAGY